MMTDLKAMEHFPVFQEREGEWTSPELVSIAGLYVPTYFLSNVNPAELNDYIVNFRTGNGDVVVVSFPKSGTTWVKEIVWQLYNDGATTTENIYIRFPMLELSMLPGTPDVTTFPSPRLMHCHQMYDVISKGENEGAKCKYIYIARNPKDVAVSFYHFIRDLAPSMKFNGPWEFFARLFVEGKVPFNRWLDHVLGWWKHKDDSNVLFLKYEDLKKDLPTQVRTIAQFLGIPVTEELSNRIAEQCTFKAMKTNEPTYGSGGGETLLRKGEIGDWKNYFTPELNERFEKEVLAKFKGTGLKFDFDL